MPITGSQKALMFAQSDVERVGASRAGYHSSKVAISVGGVHRAYGAPSASDKIEALTIQLTNTDTPNRASFRAIGWVPSVGMEVVITLGSTNRLRRLFGGTVLDVKEYSVGLLRQFQVECVDWSWLLDDEPIYGHFTGSASTIAIALMADAPAGFTTRQVEADLPTLTGGITFTGVKRSVAIRRLAKRAGVRSVIDERKDLYFRATPAAHWTNPTNIVGALDTLKAFTFERDLGQIANRVPFIGGGANALAEGAIGETVLALVEASSWWYGDVGGVVISGPQRITYTARVEGGGGSLIGPGASPSSAPTLALAAGSGVTAGAHDVTVVFVTASGRSLPSPVRSITTGNVSAPVSAATAGTPTTGGSMNAGAHRYYPVFRTAAGSTTAGPVSNAVTATASDANPTSVSGTAGAKAGGSLDLVTSYRWTFSYRRNSDNAETLPNTGSFDASLSAGNLTATLNLTFYSVAAPPGYSLAWYRSEDAGATYKEVTSFSYELDGGGNYRFVDGSASATLGAAPPVANNTAKGTCAVTGIPVSADSLVTHVDMYREFNAAGASTAKLAFSVTNGTTSGNDTLANASLGATVPSTNTAAAGQIAASAIPIGGTGTTDRELYMSPAGGGARKLALAIANNTATTGTITISDATLAGNAAEPVTDTSGLAQPSGQVLPGATSILVAGTAPFRSAGGWAFTGTQQIRYTGFTGSSLTGIPSSGVGSIQQPLTYNTVIAAAPMLIGIPASGAGSILYTIPKGEAVNLIVTVEDTDAQAGLQSLLSAAAPVVRECPPLEDRRLSRSEALNRATAFLTLRAYPGVRVGPYRSKDVNNRIGMEVSINVTTPVLLNDTFQIQGVTISNFTPNIMPDYAVQASDELFSLEALLAKEQ